MTSYVATVLMTSQSKSFFLNHLFKLCEDKLPECLNGKINSFTHYLLTHVSVKSKTETLDRRHSVVDATAQQ